MPCAPIYNPGDNNMKNIFALFVIFAGIINPLTVLAASPVGGGDFEFGGSTEYNECANKCNEADNPCNNFSTKCYDNVYTNAYNVIKVAKCTSTKEIQTCHWELVDLPDDAEAIDRIICKQNYYFNINAMCQSQISPLNPNIITFTCCNHCSEGLDFGADAITDKAGATSPAECYVPGPITTDASDETKCKGADEFWFDGKCHKKQTDGKGNTFILTDDCHHNEYVAPATPASDE